MKIFPQPREMTLTGGAYRLDSALTGLSLVDLFGLSASDGYGIVWNTDPLFGKEEYDIRISPDGILVTSACAEGRFRAATTLRMLVRRTGGEIPCAHIHDSPQLARRGYMLDISRGRMPRMDTIKRMVDMLAELKYNEFQLYMEGDCFKYAAYPEETADFDCLGPEDIRELDAYCRERFIDLVPNQNSFGHMYTWLKKPAFHHLGLFEGDETPSTLNPLLEESFDFVCGLYRSLLPNFTSDFVNIGLDEAYGLGKFQIEEYCREKGSDVVFMEWLNRLNDHIASTYGKRVMFWADMIYNYPESYHMVPEGVIALEWGYELIQSQRMTAHCIAYRDAGVKYYVCPATNVHGSFSGRMDVTTFNIRTCAELAVEYGAEGMLLTDWGDGGHPQPWLWSMVPIALAGQYGWNTGDKQDGESFKADFIRAAEDYIDDTAFGGAKVSRLLYRMANYYLLEPERVHVCTMSAKQLTMPIGQTKYAHLFDLKDSGDDFYFDNVTDYVRRVMADIEKLDFDQMLKREIRMTARLIEIGSEFCKVKLHPADSREKAAELAAMIDALIPEYTQIWNFRNYERGINKFMDHLVNRRAELEKLHG